MEDEVVNMMITKRDVDLMQWINAMGFVTIGLIAKKLKIALPTAYARIRKLTNHGYLYHERIFFGLPGVYYLTSKGIDCSGSALPGLRRISRGTYQHDLTLALLSLKLADQFGCEYISERSLKYEKMKDGIGIPGHIPDGMLLLENKKIAIEVELSKKGARRLQKIMQEYLKNFDIDEVWYFCGSADIKRQVDQYQPSIKFLKVLDLPDLHDQRERLRA